MSDESTPGGGGMLPETLIACNFDNNCYMRHRLPREEIAHYLVAFFLNILRPSRVAPAIMRGFDGGGPGSGSAPNITPTPGSRDMREILRYQS